MKIAVTYESGLIFQHFGHTSEFKIYEVRDQDVIASHIVSAEGFGHGALAGFLQQQGVDILICGGIGGGAQMALANAGVRLYGGVCGDADDAVQAFLSGELEFNPYVRCNHHDHACGSHSCAGHTCH